MRTGNMAASIDHGHQDAAYGQGGDDSVAAIDDYVPYGEHEKKCSDKVNYILFHVMPSLSEGLFKFDSSFLNQFGISAY